MPTSGPLAGHAIDASQINAKTFWARVDVRGPDECWDFRRPIGAKYGQYHIKMPGGGWAYCTSNRVAYALAHGLAPAGALVLHSCHRPGCVNPAHLRIGSNADNMNDKNENGTMIRGEQINTAVRTADTVRAVRVDHAAGMTYGQLSAKYGIPKASIRDIVKRRTWAHVD